MAAGAESGRPEMVVSPFLRTMFEVVRGAVYEEAEEEGEEDGGGNKAFVAFVWLARKEEEEDDEDFL